MRAAPGEILALVRAALRENPRGLTANGVSDVTGLDARRANSALRNYEAMGHVERRDASIDPKWYLPRETKPARAAEHPAPLAKGGYVVPDVVAHLYECRGELSPAAELIYRAAQASVAKALPPRSIFDPRPLVAPLMSPGSSRVMAGQDTFVQADDFTPGAFMADWRRRTGQGSSST